MSPLADEVEVAYPQQPHVATVLLLDTSVSMAGAKIDALNKGLKLFLSETAQDELASKRVDLAIVTFGGDARVAHPFAPVTAYEPMELTCNGGTPMAVGLEQSLRLIEERKAQYRAEGTDYYRPWLFLITDGEPTDMHMGDGTWTRVTGDLHEALRSNKLAFFAVGVDGANMELLAGLCGPGRQPLRLRGLDFRELFVWLSRSQRQVSASQTGQKVALPPVNWGEV